jgi:hypothetical protein
LSFRRALFRAALNSKTLSRLAELGWQNTNMNAAVNAVKVIRGDEEQARSMIPAPGPGLTIRIVQIATPIDAAPKAVNAPAIELEPAEPQRDADGYLVKDGRRVFEFDPHR